MPPRRGRRMSGSATPKRGDDRSATDRADFQPEQLIVVPEEQLELTPEELSKEITKILRADNPNAPTNIARFNHRERQFKLEPSVEQTEFHFVLDSLVIAIDSAEGRDQTQRETASAAESTAEGTPGTEASASGAVAGGAAAGEDTRGLRNQFNFSERASQTFNNPLRDRSVETEPPPTAEFSATATQYVMFDAYLVDQEVQRRERELAQQKMGKVGGAIGGGGGADGAAAGAAGSGGTSTVQASEKHEDVVHGVAMSRKLRFAERMVNQNTFCEVAHDFRYWEDDSDRYREEGTLLPLWQFRCDSGRRKHVTALCWNPEFRDMFAVGYGSYDFMHPSSGGVVACFSLKNPSHPEIIFTTESGVMCCDFHAQHSSLLCVGLYDGTVMIYDVRQKVNRPIFQSTIRTGKHTDPVWEVRWQGEDFAKNLNFFSVSSDGRVANWTLSKNELQYQNVIELKLREEEETADIAGAAGAEGASGGTEGASGVEPTEAALVGLAGGCCFDFNRRTEHLFLVGTEEGRIHECSKAYNSQYLETYEGHHMAVYAVRWNLFHPRVFLSASADWTVKLWDHGSRFPVMSFDLGNSVGDVAWAPFSSTVFAAVTNDGKVFVYDLHENKHDPVCEQQIVKKAKLTHISFNPLHPIILVGDDRGTVSAMKLSPNLRKAVLLSDDEAAAAAAASAAAASASAASTTPVPPAGGGGGGGAGTAPPAPGSAAAVVDPLDAAQVARLDAILAGAEKADAAAAQ